MEIEDKVVIEIGGDFSEMDSNSWLSIRRLYKNGKYDFVIVQERNKQMFRVKIGKGQGTLIL